MVSDFWAVSRSGLGRRGELIADLVGFRRGQRGVEAEGFLEVVVCLIVVTEVGVRTSEAAMCAGLFVALARAPGEI